MRKTSHFFGNILAILTIYACAGRMESSAATLSWTGNPSGDFNAAENWDPVQGPVSTDTVNFNQPGTSVISFNADGSTYNANFQSGTFVIETGAFTWFNGNTWRVGNLNAPGTFANVTLDGGSVVIANPNDLIIGAGVNDDGNTFTLTNGAQLQASPIWVGYVGDSGSGNALVIEKGSTFATAGLRIGWSSDSGNNQVTVTGTGSALISNSLHPTPGVNWSNIDLGNATNSTGNSLTVSDGGTVEITNTEPSAARVRLGISDGADNNRIVVSGAGSSFSTNGDLVNIMNGSSEGVGNSITVSDGGVLTALDAVLNNFSTTSGGKNSFTLAGGAAHFASVDVRNGNRIEVSAGTLNVSGIFWNGDGGSAAPVSFSGGTISAGGARFHGGSSLIVGDGNSDEVAVYHADGGLHVFTGGLALASDGRVTGGGTIGNIDNPTTVTTAAASVIEPGDGIGTLSIHILNTLEGAIFDFELGSGHISDQLHLTTWDATGAAAGSLVFNLTALASVDPGLYTLVLFDASSGLTLDQFAFGVIPDGFSGNFILNAASLQLQVVPEPATWALLLGAFLLLGIRARAWYSQKDSTIPR